MDRSNLPSSSRSASSPPTAGSASIDCAVERLSNDGFIGYPTETVWGLGACADRPQAIDRLFDWKGRATDQPMSVLVSSLSSAIGLGCHFDRHAELLARSFWPGPLTLVIPSESSFAPGVARADGALGLRCSGHPVVLALVAAIEAAGLGPITSTSMNRSGRTPAEDSRSAEEMVAGATGDTFASPLLVWAGASLQECDAGAAPVSSVVDCTGAVPKILRAGALDAGLLETAWNQSPN
ncbi:MAG TPA: Sua5/YciO/YrdC/YwlC family protein [Myxococcales bacterium]|nr:Sua5/YciO/YrdC/YwlC family protein [Myxococcales bacterium]HIK86628.1 Sua5/YciO/YrdC/YwlC family protein [Myxococcales bacterium]